MGVGRIEILREFEPQQIEQLRRDDQFFWADLGDDVPVAEIGSTLGLDQMAAHALGDLTSGGPPRRRLYVEDELIVFAFSCATRPDALPHAGLGLERVNVLVHGDFLITYHERSFNLERMTTPIGGRVEQSEHYVLYVVLDGMVNSMLEALAGAEGEIARLERGLWDSGWRQRPSEQAKVRALRSRLTELRLKLGPEEGLFERIAQEIERMPTLTRDEQRYFERIHHQLEHAVERVDAASETLSNAVQVQLNETTYRLTLVATVFLPLSFIAGFFGMNFGWMVDHIDSAGAFWMLVGASMILPLIAFGLFARLNRS